MTNYKNNISKIHQLYNRIISYIHYKKDFILVNIVTTDYIFSTNFKKSAVNKINNEFILTDIAINNNDSNIALIAAKKITNEALSKKIFLESKGECEKLCLIVLKNIRNQRILTQLYIQRTNSMLRDAIIHKITDESFLYKIALNPIQPLSMRYAAIKRLLCINPTKLKNSSNYLVKLFFKIEKIC